MQRKKKNKFRQKKKSLQLTFNHREKWKKQNMIKEYVKAKILINFQKKN